MINRETISYELEERAYEQPEHVYSMQEKRLDKRMRKKRRRRRMRLFILLLILLLILLVLFARSSFFDVQKITVVSNEYYTDEQIIEMCHAKTGGNIFAVKTRNMKSALQKDPYIESVKIDRKLPAEVVISVKEKKETAVLYSGGKYYITDGSGLVLRITDKRPPVTRLIGFKVTAGKVNEPITVDNNPDFTKNLSMMSAAAETDIKFRKVVVKDNISKAYVYDNLYVRGTAENIKDCIKSGTLEAVLYDLTKKDIRNGMVRVGDDDFCVFTPEN